VRIEASYLAHEAARLAGVSGDRIGQWARWGHIRASISDGDPHVYAYEDVAEAIAVHDLLERGVRLPAIRATVERYGGSTKHPLSTNGLELVGLLPLNGHVPAPELLRRGGWAARLLPDLEWVEVDPTRMGGRPCIRGRRWRRWPASRSAPSCWPRSTG
jgi:DNA-binding transcriptional MerR regulator